MSFASVRSHGRALGRLIRTLILLAAVAALAIPGWAWWQERQAYVFVSDARIAADMVTLSVAEAGTLIALHVRPGQRVEAGQLLAQLDARELDLKIAEAGNELARLSAERQRLKAEQRLVSARVESAVGVAAASIEMMQADHRAALATLSRTRGEVTRAESLFKRKVIASQEVEDARTAFQSADERARQGKAGIAEARARLTAARVEAERIAVLAAERSVLDANEKALLARRNQLAVRREQRDFKAGFDGVVAQTFVESGEHLRAGTRVLMMHDPARMWVAANVKETELYRFREGARVRATIDAFPDHALAGSVSWIAPAATSQFALLPNANPSGNFTKVTQRVGLRIDLDQVLPRLSPGMMVELSIDATLN
jgi:membrane fusion protein, multidrug efflux system